MGGEAGRAVARVEVAAMVMEAMGREAEEEGLGGRGKGGRYRFRVGIGYCKAQVNASSKLVLDGSERTGDCQRVAVNSLHVSCYSR